MKPTGTSLPIDGSRCDEYVITSAPNDVDSFWLDPGKDYLVRRHQRRSPKRLLYQTDIKYRKDDELGWLPASWAFTQFSSSNAVSVSMDITVLDLRINDRQPQDQFLITFPPGSSVEDERARKKYIVQDDGNMREESRRGELLPASVPQPGSPWYKRHQWLLIGGVLSVIAVGLALLARRRKVRLPQRTETGSVGADDPPTGGLSTRS
jgi:hypothetical protein